MTAEALIKKWVQDQPHLSYLGASAECLCERIFCRHCAAFIDDPKTMSLSGLEEFAVKHSHPVAPPTELENLRAEVEQLRGWKKSATKVIDDWEEVGSLVGARDGTSVYYKSAAVETADRVRTIQANLAQYRDENARLLMRAGGLWSPCQGTTQDKPAEPPKSEDTTLLDRTVREVVKAAILGAANATR